MRDSRSPGHQRSRSRSPSPAKSDSSEEVGPQPAPPPEDEDRPSGPARFRDGRRIPRGLDARLVAQYERAGFIVSNAEKKHDARGMKEERQADERRQMLKLHAEERARKEAQVISQFREMVDTLKKRP